MEALKLYPKKSKQPLKAIRLFCSECMGMNRRMKKANIPYVDIKSCTDEMCPLYDFRFGKNPFLKRRVSQGTLDALEKGRKRLILSRK